MSRAGRPHGQPDPLVTRKTGAPGGKPDGAPTKIKGDPEVRRSLEMENSAAVVLADQGYRIRQNPDPSEVARVRRETGDTGLSTKEPDYVLEGRIFDCYSPTKPNKPVRGIWTEVENKVLEEQRQTQRVVVNLADWRGSLADLKAQFRDWPIDGLKELKVITRDGETIQMELPTGERNAPDVD